MYHASNKAIAFSLSALLIFSAPPALSQDSSTNDGRELGSEGGESITITPSKDKDKDKDKDKKEDGKDKESQTSESTNAESQDEGGEKDSISVEEQKSLIGLYDFSSDDYINPPINPRASYFYLHKTPDYEMSGDGISPPINPKPPKNREKEN